MPDTTTFVSPNGKKKKKKKNRDLLSQIPSGNGAVPEISAFAEVGTSGLKRFGGEVHEEFDPNLRGLRGVRVYDEMRRNDPDVGAVLFAFLHVALGAEWFIEAASEAQPDKDAAQFLKECLFEDMSHSFRDFVTDAMTSNAFGWAFFEQVFKQRLGPDGDPPSRYDDGRIGIRKLALRGQETLARWVFDDHGGVQGMIQRSPPVFKETPIPISKAVLVRTSREKNNPEGVSMLRNAYRPYYIKTNMEEIEVIGAERDMTGVLKIFLPANASPADQATAREMGERYRVDDQTYFLLQRFGKEAHEGWDVDVVQTPGSKVVDTDKTIARCSILIMRSVLAQFLTLGQGKTGSWALSESQRGLWHLAVKGRLDTLEEEVNLYIVPKLFLLNEFPGITALPKVRHSDPGEIDIEKLTPFLRVLGELGLLDVTQGVLEHLHKRAGLPAPDPNAAEELQQQIERDRELREKQVTTQQHGPDGNMKNLPKNQDRQHQTPTTSGRPNNTKSVATKKS